MKSIEHSIGSIFQPVYHLTAYILTWIYGVVPNYGIAIALLTIVIMGILTPFTVKSTRSMKAMQNLQPEIKKLQQKYKGPENRQTMNDELMKLYREAGVNPLGGCLPMLLQMPFLIILYGVIKGLTTTVIKHGHAVAQPRYIPHHSKMYENLIHSGGHLNVWGMDLSLRVFPISSHSSFWTSLPFFGFLIIAVGLQYFQMAMMNTRNQKTGQASMPSQQQAMQRMLPIIFAFFYIAIPAAVVLYMIVSSGIRIITQDIIFRTDAQNKALIAQRALPAAEKSVVDDAETIPEKKALPPAKSSSTSAKRPSTPAKSSKQPAKPAPRPQQSQARSKSKRKRKAR